jgi:hypothetical protein
MPYLIAIVIAMAIDHRPSNLDFPKEEVVILSEGEEFTPWWREISQTQPLKHLGDSVLCRGDGAPRRLYESRLVSSKRNSLHARADAL